MNTNGILRLLTAIVVIFGLFALGDFGLFALGQAAVSVPKANHHDGKQLLGEKVKTNGHHLIHNKGNYAISVDVKDGKVAGMHVKHAKKGDVPVKKYKSNKKMAQAGGGHSLFVSLLYAQAEYVGTVWIGYAYVDEYGYENIYWFPYDMILDGDTGAIWYVPA
jgi:hypothetical protein